MPVVSQPKPSVKPESISPLQLMGVALALHTGCALRQTVQKLVQKRTEEMTNMVMRFLANPVTPAAMHSFENALRNHTREIGREVMQFAMNHIEPDEVSNVPSRLRRGHEEYSRKGKKTRQRDGVATLFGMVELWRWSYEPLSEERESGLKSISPLTVQMGLVAEKATPALAETIGRQTQECSENGVVEYLLREHGVKLSSTTVCHIRDALARGISAHLEDQQLQLLLESIRKGRKRGSVILVAGRDGIFIAMRGKEKDNRWKEAAVGTISVYVKLRHGRPKRLCTVYLGQMPMPGQAELSDQLTSLLKRVIAEKISRDIELAYITDAGHHPQDYFKEVLKKMPDPHRPGKKLNWKWIVDFYHASQRLNQLADALFHTASEALAWVEKHRHILKHEPNAVNKILKSAAALKPKSLRGKKKKDYQQAYNYMLTYRSAMNYFQFRQQQFPIGSGVTEAACKRVITQRFKCSGMIWGRIAGYDYLDPEAKMTGGNSILKLRLAVLSGVWTSVIEAYLQAQTEAAKLLTKTDPGAKTMKNAA